VESDALIGAVCNTGRPRFVAAFFFSSHIGWQYAAEKVLISGYHFPFPGLGWVEKAGSGYRLVPAQWSPVL
jgi:hypothetical protein